MSSHRQRVIVDGESRWGAREDRRRSVLGEREGKGVRWLRGRKEVSHFTLVRSPHVFAKSKENFLHRRGRRVREIRWSEALLARHPLRKERTEAQLASWRAVGLAHHFPGCRVRWRLVV